MNFLTLLLTNPNAQKVAENKGIFDLAMLQTPQDYLFKLILPIVIMLLFSTFIGLERQNLGKSAGISAHTLVGIASVMISIVQRLMFEFNGYQNNDGQRIVAQVVTGIGFLGAGVIMKDKLSVKGLTTAATIWLTAILGIILGSGYLIIGLILALIVIIFMIVRDLKRGYNPFKKSRTFEKENKTVVKRRYKLLDTKEKENGQTIVFRKTLDKKDNNN